VDIENYHRNSINNSGMSLIEVMIAAVIGMIVLYGISVMMTFNMRTSKSIQLSMDFNQLSSTIQQIINNPTACKDVFSKFNFTAPTGGSLPRPITGAVLSPLELNGAIIAKINADDGGLKVTKLEFDNLKDVLPSLGNNNRYLVNLHLEATKSIGGKAAVGAQNSWQDFMMTLVVNPGNQIVECYSTSTAEQNCIDMGGTYSASSIPKCRMPAVYQP